MGTVVPCALSSQAGAFPTPGDVKRGPIVSDAFTLTAIGAAALGPTFDFLYGHLNRLLDRRHRSDDESAVDSVEIAVPDSVSGDPRPLEADPERIERFAGDLERLAGALGPYERYPDRLSVDDNRLEVELNTLRTVLEGVYGRRITFVGEQREPSGISADLDLEDVSGKLVGVEIKGVKGPLQGPIRATMKVRGASETSDSTGVKYEAG
ncbi:hypothetical protein [Streptomyces sp. NPDC090112]